MQRRALPGCRHAAPGGDAERRINAVLVVDAAAKLRAVRLMLKISADQRSPCRESPLLI